MTQSIGIRFRCRIKLDCILETIYLLDLWRKQASSDEWVEAFCSLVKEWKPREWAEEQGQIKAGVGPFIERMQRERQAFVYAAPFPRAATRRCGRNRSGGEWPCTGSTCRRTPHGLPSCDRSFCHFRPASTMTKWMVSG